MAELPAPPGPDEVRRVTALLRKIEALVGKEGDDAYAQLLEWKRVASELARFEPGTARRQLRLIYSGDIARMLDSPTDRWDTQRARRWLRDSQIGFQLNPGTPNSQWVTTWVQFLRHHPKMMDLLVQESGVCPLCGQELG